MIELFWCWMWGWLGCRHGSVGVSADVSESRTKERTPLAWATTQDMFEELAGRGRKILVFELNAKEARVYSTLPSCEHTALMLHGAAEMIERGKS